jgi:threonine/homoserine efflux transporter RhtA
MRPGGSYRLRSELRGVDVDLPDGVCWKIYDLAGRRVAAETGGGGNLTFVAPSDVLVLMLSYERPMGLPRLAGTVAVTQVALGMER